MSEEQSDFKSELEMSYDEYLHYSKWNTSQKNRLFNKYIKKSKRFMSRERRIEEQKGRESYNELYPILKSAFSSHGASRMSLGFSWIQRYFKPRDRISNESKIKNISKFGVYPDFVAYIGPTIASSISTNSSENFIIENFQKEKKFKFPRNGEALHFQNLKHKSNLTVYAPEIFSLLQSKFEKADNYYKNSICQQWEEIPKSRKTQSLSYKCTEDYIIQSVLKNELNFFKIFLMTYFCNFLRRQHTFLPKIYGIYKNKEKWAIKTVAVMENVFDTFYDQKYEITALFQTQFCDNLSGNVVSDNLKGIEKFLILKVYYDLFFETLTRDLETLEQFRITDYKLLVGVKYSANQETDDEVLEYFNERLRTETSVGDLDIPAWTMEKERVFIKFGLDDILHQYSWQNKVENFAKVHSKGKYFVSSYPPNEYKEQLLTFLRSKIHVYYDNVVINISYLK